jgi:hypothetical protein
MFQRHAKTAMAGKKPRPSERRHAARRWLGPQLPRPDEYIRDKKWENTHIQNIKRGTKAATHHARSIMQSAACSESMGSQKSGDMYLLQGRTTDAVHSSR